jgi:hypothetical protein
MVVEDQLEHIILLESTMFDGEISAVRTYERQRVMMLMTTESCFSSQVHSFLVLHAIFCHIYGAQIRVSLEWLQSITS